MDPAYMSSDLYVSPRATATSAHCVLCKQWKPRADFYHRTVKGLSRPDSYCKPCRADISRRRRLDPDKRRHDIHIMKDKQAKRRLSPEATCATVTLDEWTRLLERWQHTCAYCQDDLHGRRMYDVTMDHFVPLSRGGSHDLGNIVPACRSCNSAKNNLYPQAFCGFDQIADLYEARFGAPVALPEAA